MYMAVSELAKRAGVNAEIAGLTPCAQVCKIMAQRLQKARHRLIDLENLKVRMEYAPALGIRLPDGEAVSKFIE